jgi:hypothetical protein
MPATPVRVVGLGRDGAGHVGAVPAGIAGRLAAAALVGRHPVARVAGVVVAAGAVVGDRRCRNHVVASHDLARQVGVRAVAGVDDGHHDAGTGRQVPGRRGADATGGLVQVPLRGVARIIGREQRVHLAVGFRVGNVGVGRLQLIGQGLHVTVRQGLVELEDVSAGAGLAQQAGLGTAQGDGRVDCVQARFQSTGGDADGAQHRGVLGVRLGGIAIADDEAVGAGGTRRAGKAHVDQRIGHAGLPSARRQQAAGQCEQGSLVGKSKTHCGVSGKVTVTDGAPARPAGSPRGAPLCSAHRRGLNPTTKMPCRHGASEAGRSVCVARRQPCHQPQ